MTGRTRRTHALEALPAPASDHAAERRKQFVSAARDAFFTQGYGATTMSSIAAKVGGSKTTFWKYFPSKQHLFAAVVDDIVGCFDAALAICLPVDDPVPEVLRHLGSEMVSALVAAPFLALYRLVVSEADRFPELAQTFYERGPRSAKQRAALWMQAKMDRGEIRMADPERAVEQFASLCKSGAFQLALLGLAAGRDTSRLASDVDDAVAFFCAAMRP